MLSDWLAPASLQGFMSTHLGRQPFAQPGAAANAIAYLDWNVLERVLGTSPAPDILIASRGRLVSAAVPRTLADARRLMAQRLGIVVRKSERHDERLAELAGAFARDVPGEVHIQLYVTPAGTQTFGWHFDLEDVFIAQTAGAKDYYFRENTVVSKHPAAPEGWRHAEPDFSLVRHETSPLFHAHLIAGDWLYIPTRWWHLVHSAEDSLSISIGVMPSARAAP